MVIWQNTAKAALESMLFDFKGALFPIMNIPCLFYKTVMEQKIQFRYGHYFKSIK